MSWYNDKISAATAELALRGAGKGAKALGMVAQIPLDIAKRKRDEFDSTTKRMKALTPIEKAKINADARKVAASLGYQGKALTANAKIIAANTISAGKRYVADKGYAKTKYRSDTDGMIQASRSADNAASRKSEEYTEKLKLTSPKPVSPKITLNYDNNGDLASKKIVRAYKKEASGANFSLFDEMEKKAKKRKAR